MVQQDSVLTCERHTDASRLTGGNGMANSAAAEHEQRVRPAPARRGRTRWVDRRLRVKGVSVLALPLLMLVVAAALFYGTALREQSAQTSVSHTRVVQEQIDQVRGLVLDGETGIRG